MKKSAKIAVIGTGAFGSALAASAYEGGNQVSIFGRDKNKVALLKQKESFKDCVFYAFDEKIPKLHEFDFVILAVSCQALRSVAEWMKKHSEATAENPLRVVCAAKGIEKITLKLPHEILKSCLPAETQIGALSGPSFAKELQNGQPTSVVIASVHEELRSLAVDFLHRPFFRVYESNDVVGVEVGGALKNVMAIAAGIADGLSLGNNARAAIVTRGLGEIAQVGLKLGAEPLTFLGLSGLGDLILTCTGDLSRNRQFGLRLAEGEQSDHIISQMGQVIEGVVTSESAYKLSKKLDLDTPIIDAIYSVIHEKLLLKDAIKSLLSREGKSEFHWFQK